MPGPLQSGSLGARLGRTLPWAEMVEALEQSFARRFLKRSPMVADRLGNILALGC